MCYSLRSVGEEHVLSWRFADSMCWSAGQTSPAELELFDLICWSAGRLIESESFEWFDLSSIYWIELRVTCRWKSELLFHVKARYVPLPQIPWFAIFWSSWAIIASHDTAEGAKQIRIASKFCVQMPPAPWSCMVYRKNSKKWTKPQPHIFPIQFDLSQAVSKCAIYCYTAILFWSVWEKGIF